MSSKIQQINSCPDYISKFIQLNMEQLCKIYDEGMNLNPGLDKGILCFLCSEKENKMNVQFMNNEMMCEIIEKDSLMQLKTTIEKNKKLLFIRDMDLNSVFLIQI
tara:strand:+ start:1397 stop:1711 length:315 start_codon:yes stop_codon:yes gene_type:complete